MKDKTGGSAFPQQGSKGMTLRDHFAVRAMQGIMGNSEMEKYAIDKNIDGDLWKNGIVKTAYEYADAMIEAREK